MCASDADAAADVIVVGAGVAGLVAAYDIARAGFTVCVLERSEHPGGRLRAVTLAGLPVELGADSFATRGGAVAALLNELGLEENIVAPLPHPAWAVTAGASYRLPVSGALGIPVHPFAADARRALGIRGAMRVALEPWRRRSTHSPTASLAEIVRDRLGARALDSLIAPVTQGVYSAAPEQLWLEAHPELAVEYARTGSLLRAARAARASHSAAGGAVQSLAGGLSVLVARLLSKLQDHGAALHTGVQNLALDCTGTGWTARWAGGKCQASAVVLAVPAHEVERLLPDALTNRSPQQAQHDETAPSGAVQISAAETAVETVAVVVTDARLDAAPCGTGALIRPGHPRIAAKALTHLTAKWAWLGEAAPAGTHVLRLSYGSRGHAPATTQLGDTQAALRALRDASQVFGMRLDPDRISAHARARWTIPAKAPDAGPTRAAGVGVNATVGLAAVAPGIMLTGDTYAGTGLASVIPHARAAARAAIAAARVVRPWGLIDHTVQQSSVQQHS